MIAKFGMTLAWVAVIVAILCVGVPAAQGIYDANAQQKIQDLELLGYTAYADPSGDLNTHGILPQTDNTYDIGSSSKKFKDAYFTGAINAGSGVFNSLTSAGNAVVTKGASFNSNGILSVVDGSAGTVSSENANAATLKVSGDTDDYFTFSTVSDIPTITATGATYLNTGSKFTINPDGAAASGAYLNVVSNHAGITQDLLIENLGTGSTFLSLHTQDGGGDPVIGFGIEPTHASWHMGINDDATDGEFRIYNGAWESGTLLFSLGYTTTTFDKRRVDVNANSSPYQLVLRYKSSDGGFILGSTDSATPDLMVMNTAGDEVARFKNDGGFNLGVSYNLKRFYQEITLDTTDAETAVGLTPNAVIMSAAIRVSTQITDLDSADHHIQLGINGSASKYIDVAQGAAATTIDVNKKGHYTFNPSTGIESSALVLTITGGADQTPTAGKVYVEVVYLDSSDLPNP